VRIYIPVRPSRKSVSDDDTDEEIDEW